MQIEIHLPRPGVTLLAIAAVSGWALYFTAGGTGNAAVIEAPPMHIATSSSSMSSPPIQPAQTPDANPTDAVAQNSVADDQDTNHLTEAEMRMKWARAEQDFLREKEDILRDQLAGIQKEREALGSVIDPALEEQFRRSVQMITSLVKDQQKAETSMRMFYDQEWEAEEHAMAAATGTSQGKVTLFWPVEPKIGISAYFMDPGYKERFKVEHYAIDIPVTQGTVVLAAADGIVKDAVDHGLGYNYVTIDNGGAATIYGHLSQFSVRPGQRVRAGDIIGLSGGMPGLPGGGLSTGPHLHFGVYVKGVPVDPLKYLPKYQA